METAKKRAPRKDGVRRAPAKKKAIPIVIVEEEVAEIEETAETEPETTEALVESYKDSPLAEDTGEIILNPEEGEDTQDKKATIYIEIETMDQGHILKFLFDQLHGLIDTVVFFIAADGIYMSSPDKGNKMLLQICLEKECFNKYTVPEDTKETPYLLAFNSAKMARATKSKKNEKMRFTLRNNQMDLLSILIKSKTRKVTNDVEVTRPDAHKHTVFDAPLFPDIPVSCSVGGVEFQKQCKSLANIGKEVTISAYKKGLILHTKAEGINSMPEFGKVKKQELDKPLFKQKFSSALMAQIAKCGSLGGGKIKFYAAEGYDLKITTEIGSLGTLTIYLLKPKKVE